MIAKVHDLCTGFNMRRLYSLASTETAAPYGKKQIGVVGGSEPVDAILPVISRLPKISCNRHDLHLMLLRLLPVSL